MTLDIDTTVPLVTVPPHPRCELCAVVPVRDERDTLEAALGALARQVDGNGAPLDPERYEVVVLANNCRDDSAAIARDFARRNARLALHVVECTLPESRAHVGYARRLLMDEACRRLLVNGRPRGVIASTDGDTRVDPRWIAGTLAAVAGGADAVGGRIVADTRDLARLDRHARDFHLRDVGYRYLAAEYAAYLDPDPHDPWPRHFQHFGPSIAITAASYRRVGGLPIQPWLEDVALYQALRRADMHLRHDPAVRVTTSTRLAGRTGFGFAVQLDRWSRMGACGEPLLVEPPAAIAAWAWALRALRDLWRRSRAGVQPDERTLTRPACELGLPRDWLGEQVQCCGTFGLLIERVEVCRDGQGIWSARWPKLEIQQAIAELRACVQPLRASRTRVVGPLEHVEPVALRALAGDVAQLAAGDG
jgi:hypothetical protein